MRFRGLLDFNGTAIFLGGAVYKVIVRRGKSASLVRRKMGREKRCDNNTISGVSLFLTVARWRVKLVAFIKNVHIYGRARQHRSGYNGQ